jgi:hypothetical protein
VGETDGTDEGHDGIFEGGVVGNLVGAGLGRRERLDPPSRKSSVGVIVGIVVGKLDGLLLGKYDGRFEGTEVGTFVGLDDGRR